MTDASAKARGRRRASIALCWLGGVLALLGGALLYARAEIFDSEALSSRAQSALEQEEVRLALAQPITDGIIDSAPGLVNGRPLLESVVVAGLDTPPARAAVGEAAKTLAAKLFDKNPNTLLLNLTDAAVIASQALEAVSAKSAGKLPKEVDDIRLAISESEITIVGFSWAENAKVLAYVLPALALLALVGGAAIAPDRRRGLQRAAAAVVGAAAVLLALLLAGHALVVAQFDDALTRDAIGALFDELFADLEGWVVAIGLGGIVLAAAARFGAEEVDPLAPLAWLAGLARRRPERPVPGVLRGLLLAVLGVGVIAEPSVALIIVAIAVGTWLLYVAVVELLSILAPAVPGAEPGAIERRVSVPRLAGFAAAGILAVVVVVVAVGGDEATGRPPGPPAACNGYPELCSERIDQVTFAATHNSMSAAEDPGWFVTNQRYGITRQLDDGIRGLLIDTHYGIQRGNGRGFGQVITDLGKENKTREEVEAELGSETVVRAEGLVGNLAFDGAPGKAEPYLCHVLCELGATPLEDELADIDDWMRTHPDEFLVVFVEDVVSPKETAAAFEESGLLDFAYIPDRALPPPTLGELISKDKRLLVMAENDSGGGKYPWYVQGFDYFQETPYTFRNEQEIEAKSSCDQSRGKPDNPLLLMNNWIESIPRDPELNGRVSSEQALGRRVRVCTRIRGLEPNIIAVDYYNEGDVLGIVNDLNGIPADAEPQVRKTS